MGEGCDKDLSELAELPSGNNDRTVVVDVGGYPVPF
jgi:hypothetical protein